MLPGYRESFNDRDAAPIPGAGYSFTSPSAVVSPEEGALFIPLLEFFAVVDTSTSFPINSHLLHRRIKTIQSRPGQC